MKFLDEVTIVVTDEDMHRIIANGLGSFIGGLEAPTVRDVFRCEQGGWWLTFTSSSDNPRRKHKRQG